MSHDVDAAILREAARSGLKVLLLEQRDFAWGTSSRSSKLVHGGLRYLKEGHFLMTKIAVAERERLLNEAPGLVESLGFLLPIYEDQTPGRRTMQVGLSLYDIMARERQHQYYDAEAFIQMVPHINPKGLKGGFHFLDAQVDDARLVLRLINESVSAGAYALNYTAVRHIDRNDDGRVAGVELEDVETHEIKNVFSQAVINATAAAAMARPWIKNTGTSMSMSSAPSTGMKAVPHTISDTATMVTAGRVPTTGAISGPSPAMAIMGPMATPYPSPLTPATTAQATPMITPTSPNHR